MGDKALFPKLDFVNVVGVDLGITPPLFCEV